MNQRVAYLAVVFSFAAAISVGCGSDDDNPNNSGGTSGKAGSAGAAGKSGSGGSGGSNNQAGSENVSGSAGEGSPAGSTGTDQGGAAGDHGDHGDAAGSDQGGASGEGGAGPARYTEAQIERGKVLVRSVAICGNCHTGSGSGELGGNAMFANGTLPAPNLTNDATGIGEWTDAQVINAIRNGIDDENRHLNSAMPYWLFHNMSDADALSVVAFLRSLPPVAAEIGATNPDATPVTPLDPSSLPATTLPSTDPEYAAAQQGKYLVSGVAQCIKCHSPSNAARLPIPDFFSGVPVPEPPKTFASNITPDVASGIGGWTPTDVVTALKVGTNKAGVTLCGAMPSGAKGYGGMTDADAHAIGVYLTTIPAVSKPTAAPGLEPACPAPNP